VLNHEYPPVGGGGGKACQDIAFELADRGHEIKLLTSHFKGLPRDEDHPNLQIIRLPVLRQSLSRAGLVTMKVYILSSIFKGCQLMKSWKPDIIHVHFAVPAGAAAYLLHRLMGIPYVITAHLGDIPGGSPQKTDRWFRVIYPFTRPIWRSAAAITTVSSFTASLIKEHYAVTPQVIPNGIAIRESLLLTTHQPPVIVFAGRFVEQKNLGAIMDVLESIRHLPWSCVMLGDGPLHDQVAARIAKVGMKDRFSLPGWVNPEEVKNAMEKSDILFMPSLYEGLPVAGVQALQSGLAIVASAIGGFQDLVEHGKNGFLCSPTDARELSEKLTLFLTDREELMRAKNHSLEVAKKFDIQKVADQYESVLLSAINQPLK
jgi:glycosyltransferase involved in cell wall biosynthesis